MGGAVGGGDGLVLDVDAPVLALVLAVVVRRDRSAGRRGTVLPFAGLWVFPGGHIAPADRARCDTDDSLGQARHAAARDATKDQGDTMRLRS